MPQMITLELNSCSTVKSKEAGAVAPRQQQSLQCSWRSLEHLQAANAAPQHRCTASQPSVEQSRAHHSPEPPAHGACRALPPTPASSKAVASAAGCSGSTMTTELPAPTIWFQLHTALPGKQSPLKFSMPAAWPQVRRFLFFFFLLFSFFLRERGAF